MLRLDYDATCVEFRPASVLTARPGYWLELLENSDAATTFDRSQRTRLYLDASYAPVTVEMRLIAACLDLTK